MRISIIGKGSETLLQDFGASGLQFTRHRPAIGQVMNSGELIEILSSAKGVTPWAAIATVLVAWLRARASGKVIITHKNKQIFHAEGMSSEEVERLLPLCESVVAMETKKPDPQKEAKP